MAEQHPAEDDDLRTAAAAQLLHILDMLRLEEEGA